MKSHPIVSGWLGWSGGIAEKSLVGMGGGGVATWLRKEATSEQDWTIMHCVKRQRKPVKIKWQAKKNKWGV